MSQNQCEVAQMSCEAAPLDAMRILVREAAEPAVPGESVKAAIGRAARRLGLTYSRAFDHWYGRARSVSAAEWIATQQAKRALMLARRDQLLREIESLERRLTDDEQNRPAMGFDSRGMDRGDMPSHMAR